MSDSLYTPIAYLKGIGPQKAELLWKELGISLFIDLLYHFPFRYVDRSKIHQCAQIHLVDGYVQCLGYIDSIQEIGNARHKRLQCRFSDESGSIQLLWFQGWRWIKPTLVQGKKYMIFGKAKSIGNHWSIAHPEISPAEESITKGFQPMYGSTEKLNAKGLNSRGIEKAIRTLFEQVDFSKQLDFLPEYVIEKHKMPSFHMACRDVHFPNTVVDFQRAQFRFKFEELFLMQFEIILRKGIRKRSEKGFLFPESGEILKTFYNEYLPFDLTNAQKRVIREIRKDFLTERHMNRLLQGDVGSGKTLVALISMLIANGNNYQAALLAPTEILAYQHAETLTSLLQDLPVRVELLTGSTKKSKRTPLLSDLAEGLIHILVGTHALLEDPVIFKNLGLVVIDEQHRFGVAQRAKMRTKNTLAPHVLVMTATPIPRTLAMTFYGDLEISVIDELPPGRKPIQTLHRYDSHRSELFGFMRKEIEKGRQIYIVYPLIEDSETLDFKSLTDGFEAISRAFPLPTYQVSIVHGKLKPEVKAYEMKRFVDGITNIMVATTVIEVGVNVPNATVMVIESAQRFGLSQLHQLRGRVGRGGEKSFCILMTPYALSKEAKIRMETMVDTTDGFKIAEVDLALRGPGDLLGTQQSGALNFKMADLSKDQAIVILARDEAEAIYNEDPRLENPKHLTLRKKMVTLLQNKPEWDKIA